MAVAKEGPLHAERGGSMAGGKLGQGSPQFSSTQCLPCRCFPSNQKPLMSKYLPHCLSLPSGAQLMLPLLTVFNELISKFYVTGNKGLDAAAVLGRGLLPCSWGA